MTKQSVDSSLMLRWWKLSSAELCPVDKNFWQSDGRPSICLQVWDKFYIFRKDIYISIYSVIGHMHHVDEISSSVDALLAIYRQPLINSWRSIDDRNWQVWTHLYSRS